MSKAQQDNKLIGGWTDNEGTTWNWTCPPPGAPGSGAGYAAE